MNGIRHSTDSRARLPGITKIRMIDSRDLPRGLMWQSICGCVHGLAVSSEAVEFIGRPLLKWEGVMVNGSRQEKATLEFKTHHPLPEGRSVAFVVTAADGIQYLIGTREPKYPVITYTETTGAPEGEGAVRSYKITHVAAKSVLRCVL